ncbi:MAG: hypothetical protein U0350_06700 [Caldilineaceae bacterium]
MANGNYFDDIDRLDEYTKDMRATDNLMVSSRENAKTVLDSFRAGDTSSPWQSLDRIDIANRLEEIIDNPRFINQGSLNLCGPAAFICMWNGRDPVGFVTYATQLYDYGEAYIGNLLIRPGTELMSQDYNEMLQRMSYPTPAADWMVLGALRNTTNVFWQGTWEGDPEQKLAGLTRPGELAGWLEATGIYSQVINDGNWSSYAGLPHAMNLSQSEGTDIALLIHMNLINVAEGQSMDQSFILSQFPNHYIVLLNEVVQDIQTKKVYFSIWTHGNTKIDLSVTEEDFIANYYGAVIAQLA